MSKANTDEEKRAALIIKYRNLKKDKEEREGDKITYYLSRGDKRYIMLILIDIKTIGIAYVRELKELIDEHEADKGILVGNGKYSYSAKSTAPKLRVELIPPTLPTFDIFRHSLVSTAEIVDGEDKQKLIETYHAQPFQFPWVKVDDPVSIILGTEPGDVIKIMAKSQTAGLSESYRYVV